MPNYISEQCIHCGLCTKNCLFLEKYQMDLAEFEEHPEKAYSCFLCGRCKDVCPKNIDGAYIALSARKSRSERGQGADKDKCYRGLLAEKSPYKFANYRKSKKKSVLFPGCNFMSFFPECMKRLEKIMKENDIGILYECCQKPVSELGLEQSARESLLKMEEKLKKQNVNELIMVCPNCYYFLKDKIQIPVTTIYKKLRELGEGIPIEQSVPIYYPCPDRRDKEIFDDMQFFLRGGITEPFTQIQCCGLGGCAAAKEPELSRMMAKKASSCNDYMYTYCASCVSNFKRKGYPQVEHILELLLGVEEEVPLGIRPFINRAKKIL